jgi:hypothetical protein
MIRAIIILLALTGCGGVRSDYRDTSPLTEMMKAHARGEKACVRNGVLVKHPSSCAKLPSHACCV